MYFRSHSFKVCVDSKDADLYGFVLVDWFLNGTKSHTFSYDSTDGYFASWLTRMNYSFDVRYCAFGYYTVYHCHGRIKDIRHD